MRRVHVYENEGGQYIELKYVGSWHRVLGVGVPARVSVSTRLNLGRNGPHKSGALRLRSKRARDTKMPATRYVSYFALRPPSSSMANYASIPLSAIVVFFLSLSASIKAADQASLSNAPGQRRGYSKGDLMPVTCLNRTLETGEHITDSHGNLQYIPFPVCNETNQPLAFPYATPLTQTCTIPELPDELYHLIEFFVHSDVPLACRIPTYPLSTDSNSFPGADPSKGGSELEIWTPLTIALQGTLQYSHLHMHTNINVLFHTSDDASISTPQESSRLIASAAYSLPNNSVAAPREGTKIIRNEPLQFVFNVGWVDGDELPGMVGRPVLGVTNHRVGFSLLSFFACAASAGIGAMGMLVYERKKSGRSNVYGNGLLGGNVGANGARTTGYGGYGGYGGYNGGTTGKRD